jgi:hypothetical protein
MSPRTLTAIIGLITLCAPGLIDPAFAGVSSRGLRSKNQQTVGCVVCTAQQTRTIQRNHRKGTMSTLKKWEVRLKDAKQRPLAVTIEAKSSSDARKIAEAQFPGHRFGSLREIKEK